MGYKIPQMIPYIGNEELRNIKIAIKNKWITEGPFSEQFLELIKSKTGAKYAVLANNGTLALFMSLLALDIKEGDEVIVPNFTFIASATSVAFVGAKPVFVDVDINTGNIDASLIEKAITKNTKAIMPVHVYGQSADMDAIVEIARKYDLKIIEDAAQGFGVYYKSKHTGTIGDIGTISFFADKTITSGEGAVILTNNEELFLKLKLLRNQGRPNSGTFIHPFLGMNFRMTDLQCAVGVAQIKKFDKIVDLKNKNLALYLKLLENVDEIQSLKKYEYTNLIPFRANFKVKDKDLLFQYLENEGIQTRSFFYPMNKQPCFSKLNLTNNDFPVSDKLYETGCSLPIFADLKKRQIEFICEKIKNFYGKK